MGYWKRWRAEAHSRREADKLGQTKGQIRAWWRIFKFALWHAPFVALGWIVCGHHYGHWDFWSWF